MKTHRIVRRRKDGHTIIVHGDAPEATTASKRKYSVTVETCFCDLNVR